MREIEIKLIEVITLLEYLLYKEDFKAYRQLLKSYKKVYFNLNKKLNSQIKEEDFSPIENAFRLFFEAVPSDNTLGKYLADKMQEFFEIQEKVILKNNDYKK